MGKEGQQVRHCELVKWLNFTMNEDVTDLIIINFISCSFMTSIYTITDYFVKWITGYLNFSYYK